MTPLRRAFGAFLLAAAGSSAMLPAAQQPRPSARPAPGAAVVRGQVLAADSNVPIRDVMVTLLDTARASTSLRGAGEAVSVVTAAGLGATPIAVDDAGRFEFKGVPPGQYRVLALPGPTAAQYVEGQFPNPDTDDPLSLTVAGAAPIEVVVSLPRAAVITGRVADDRGNPFSMAQVSARRALPGGRIEQLILSRVPRAVYTDDTGAFRIFGLPPGEYVIVAQPASGTLTFLQPQGNTVHHQYTAPLYATTYYPGTGSIADAARIRLASGETHGPIEIALARGRKYVVRGLLLDSNGQPVPSTSVSLQPADATAPMGGRVTQSTRADGTFELVTTTPGDYAIRVYRYGPALREFAWTPVAVHDDVEGVLVMLRPGISVSGQVLFDGQAPDIFTSLQVRSMPGRGTSVNASSVQPNPDRTFTLEHQFGPTLVRADGLRGWHLKSVLYAGRDITDQPTEFGGDGQLQVIVSRHMPSLSGTVATRRGSPADASVVLLSEDPALWDQRFTTTRLVQTAAMGAYRFEGVRPGRYLAVAVPRADASLSNTTPAYFELLASHATPVSIVEGQAKSLGLTLVSLRQ